MAQNNSTHNPKSDRCPPGRLGPPGRPGQRYVTPGAAFVVALVAFVVFLPAINNEFVIWDDDFMIYENAGIRSLDAGFFKWAFTDTIGSLWIPLSLVSLAIDYALWGLDPRGFHLTNVVLHSANTFLVALIATRLVEIGSSAGGVNVINKRALAAGVVTALLFALHPLQVEPVVWATGRKDVLFALFYLASVLAYLGYATSSPGGKGSRRYLAALLFFACSLMSKPLAVTLPATLLILDFYPLERFSIKAGLGSAARVVLEKVPFILLALSISLFTIWFNRTEGAMRHVIAYTPVMLRIFKGIRDSMVHLYKTVLPVDLAPLYRTPGDYANVFTFDYYIPIALFTAITVLAAVSLRNKRHYLAAWLYYLVTLSPALWIMASADRFSYLPNLAPFLLVGLLAGASFDAGAKKRLRALSAVLVLTVSVVLAVLTVRQSAVWKDSMTLWSHQIRLDPTMSKPYNNRGTAHFLAGDVKMAMDDFNKAIELKPLFADAYYNRAEVYRTTGDIERAVRDYSKTIAINPGFVRAHNNLANTLMGLGETKRAVEHYTSALRLDPGMREPYNNRGIARVNLGEHTRAIEDFSMAIRVDPGYLNAYKNRARTYELLDRDDKAIRDYASVLALDPSDKEAYYNKALAHFRLDEREEALGALRKAAALGHAKARDYLRQKRD